jgi:hypothetical protein
MYYFSSTTVCTPSALSQEGGMLLGAQAGEARLGLAPLPDREEDAPEI